MTAVLEDTGIITKFPQRTRTRLLLQSGDRGVAKYHRISRPLHEQYAEACDADYLFFEGRIDPAVHAAWNRVPMIFRALRGGYRKIVWMDADTLVVDQSRNIFTETPDEPALLMMRVLDGHVGWPWHSSTGEQTQGPYWDAYNDGVLVVNASQEAEAAMSFVWGNRYTPLRAHHHDALWELNWVLDYVYDHPESVGLLDCIWNWMPFAENLWCEGNAVIKAWHGMPHEDRWRAFHDCVRAVYGNEVAEA